MTFFLQSLFFTPVSDQNAPPDKKRIAVATCVLLLEMAAADEESAPVEMQTIHKILRNDLGLSEDETKEILDIASRQREDTVDLWHYTNLFNERFSYEEKVELVEQIWKVVYADGVLDAYEDQLMHKLAYLLHVKHSDLIDAKLRVKSS